jgi:hypothetical protein
VTAFRRDIPNASLPSFTNLDSVVAYFQVPEKVDDGKMFPALNDVKEWPSNLFVER